VLPKAHRLKKKKDFERVFKKGKGKREGFLFLKFIENERNISRVGFVVSKKISKKATLRNRIKRKLREATRMLLPEIKPGFDIVIVAKKGIENLNFWETKENLEKLFKKSNLKCL
jgi:ribonuclease P protein component